LVSPSAASGDILATLKFDGDGSGIFDLNISSILISGNTPDYNDPAPFSYSIESLAETDENQAPTAIKLSNNTIAENKALALVGSLSVTDPDAKDSHKLTLSGQDAASFYISSSSYTGHSLKWTSNTGADYETKSSYNIIVIATDSGDLIKIQPFTIKVTDVVEGSTNKAPTSISLSGNSIAENKSLALVGLLSVTDPDSNDSHTFSLSGQDAKSFYIDSNYYDDKLKWNAVKGADYETQSSYSVTVTATDSGGLSKSQPFTIKVTDVDETTSTDNGDSSMYDGKNNDSGDTTTPSTQKTLYGSAGNDILDGFSGYDIIDGKGGLDTAKYSVASTEVKNILATKIQQSIKIKEKN
jgi:hypothetical protein